MNHATGSTPHGLRIAVVTPCFQEPLAVLRRCVESVSQQSVQCSHFLVSDGDARSEVAALPVQHIALATTHHDCGDTPRLIGSVSAIAQGYDALLWLDADNWFEPDHVERMLEASVGVTVVTAARMLRRPDGSRLGVCTESDGNRFNDTNCYLLLRPAFHLARYWGFKPVRDAVIGDRIVWEACVRRHERIGRNPVPTLNYTTHVAAHYLSRNEVPPSDARVILREDDGYRSILYSEFLRSRQVGRVHTR